MRKTVSVIIFCCLFLVPGYAEVKSKSFNLETTVEKTETKADNLDAFENLNWETDMDHAFELAKKEHKNVMVMIECITCKWCIKMKKEALSDPQGT